MYNNEKIILTKITNKDTVLKIPKDFIINDFNEMMDGFKVKGNKKTKFIEEFTKQLIEYIEYNDVFSEIYDELMSNEEIENIETAKIYKGRSLILWKQLKKIFKK